MSPKTKTDKKPKAGIKAKDGLDSRPKGTPDTKPTGKMEAHVGSDKDQERERAIASVMLSPNAAAAVASRGYLKTFGEPDVAALMHQLRESMNRVNGGDLKDAESMLMGQAQALQAIFMHLADRSSRVQAMKQYELDLRLALKAQAQCCRTLEVLAGIKNPPVLFAKQANFANGPQQVNNGTPAPGPSPAGKVETISNELMEAQDAERVD